jgi:hypothetical protein
MDDEKIENIARVCHEANRAYCAGLGDSSQVPWDEAPGWQRESCIKGVRFRLDNPNAPSSAQHERWMADKLADGWMLGAVKDPDKKTHPCLVPFRDLPLEQQRKDVLFGSIVEALS